MKKPNGYITKIVGLLIAAALIGAGGLVWSRAIASIDEPRVRTLIDDKLDPIQADQERIHTRLDAQSKKLDDVHDKQIKTITILERMENNYE